MKFKGYVFIIFLIFLLLFVQQNWKYLYEEPDLMKFINFPNAVIFLFAITVLVFGSLLRTLRTKILLDRAQKGRLWPEFQIFIIGTATNIISPLRIGDIFRSFLYSRYLRISWAYSLAVILFEIGLDLFLLSSTLLIVSVPVDTFPPDIRMMALISAAFSLFLVVGIGLLSSGNSWLMKFLLFVSEPLSDKYKFRFRHSSWASIHAFQRFLSSPKDISRYLALTLCSWFLYVFSATLIFKFVYEISLNSETVYLTPFLTLSTLIGAQNIESFSTGLINTIEYFTSSVTNLNFSIEGAVAIWQTLNLPFLIIGTIFIFAFVIKFPVIQKADWNSFSNLSRLNSSRSKLTLFVDSYFRKDALAMTIHAEDVRGEFEVLGYFKGGSGAVTALVSKNNLLMVRKTVSKTNEASLIKQHQWLIRNRNNPLIVNALDSNHTKNGFSYNLEYLEKSVSAFDFIHSHNFEENSKLIQTVLNNCNTQIYSLNRKKYTCPEISSYNETHLYNRVKFAAESNVNLSENLKSEYIIINGCKYLNFFSIFNTIQNNEEMIIELSSMRHSGQIHGDLTIDNILVNTFDNQPVIIDPSDDNPICGPVLDYARLLQSLLGGYEFINQEQTAPLSFWNEEHSCPEIIFADLRSQKYSELARFVLEESKSTLSIAEYQSLTFHVGLFFGRMLSHRVRINPDTSLIYLSKSIQFLNEYVNDFEKRHQ